MNSFFSGINFVCFGEQPDDTNVIHRKDFSYWGIQYTHTGKVFLSVDDSPVSECDAACAFITMPGHDFHYGSLSGVTRYHAYLCFSGERVNSYLQSGLLDGDPGKIFRIGRKEQFLRTMQSVFRLLCLPGGRSNPRAVLLLEDLLLQLQEQPELRKGKSLYCTEQIQNLRDVISRTPEKEYSAELEAGRLSISVQHFRRLFREVCGTSFNRFQMECRLNAAENLLAGTVMSVADVAHRAGFRDEFYFSRLFRKYRGIAPSEARSGNHSGFVQFVHKNAGKQGRNC